MADVSFIFFFLPISLVLYWMAPSKTRGIVLIILNILFYFLWSPEYGVFFIILLVTNVAIVLALEKTKEKGIKKLLLIAAVVINIGLLAFFKYSSQLSSQYVQKHPIFSLAVPLGLSFFTFKAVSLAVDTYQGNVIPGGLSSLNYLSFFAQIASGPISRYADMMRDNEDRSTARVVDCISTGFVRFAIGLSKKVLIANVLENVVSEAFAADITGIHPAMLWLGSFCYSLQLLMDFSGYSDMAIGVSMMFGFYCPENFKYPYTATTLSDFWRRWHITLGSWFRDYVYIPLGGNRVKSKSRLYFNIMMVWLLTGLWHGANWTFICWGLMHGVIICLEKALLRKDHSSIFLALYRIFLLLIVNFGWVMFRSESIACAFQYICGMFTYSPQLDAARTIFLLTDYCPFILAGVFCSVPFIPWIKQKLKKQQTFYLVLSRGLLFAVFFWAVASIVSGANNPFAYANF